MDEQMKELLERIAKGELHKEMERLASKSREHAEKAERLYQTVHGRSKAEPEAQMSIMYSNAAIMLQNAVNMFLAEG